jgi:LacI family transcriptional regulator
MKLRIEDIAQLAGVSRSTVSRVINCQGEVSSEVRQRVLDVVKKTGFRAHAAARSLASSRSGVIGLVIPSRVQTIFDDPYFPKLIEGVSQASNAAGTTLSLFVFHTESEEKEIHPRVVAPGLVDGVIVTATRMGDPLLGELVGGDLPFVVVGRPEHPQGMTFVDVDNVGGARLAVLHLFGLGYRRIGFIGAPMNTTPGIDRRAGFLHTMEEVGAPIVDQLLVEGDYGEQSGYDGMQELLHGQPDGVFVATDTMAVGALRALRDAGLRVPEDIALVGFDGLAPSERAVPALTTVRQPVNEAGTRAVELLLAMVNGDLDQPVHEVLPVKLVIRDSCGSGLRTKSLET